MGDAATWADIAVALTSLIETSFGIFARRRG